MLADVQRVNAGCRRSTSMILLDNRVDWLKTQQQGWHTGSSCGAEPLLRTLLQPHSSLMAGNAAVSGWPGRVSKPHRFRARSSLDGNSAWGGRGGGAPLVMSTTSSTMSMMRAPHRIVRISEACPGQSTSVTCQPQAPPCLITLGLWHFMTAGPCLQTNWAPGPCRWNSCRSCVFSGTVLLGAAMRYGMFECEQQHDARRTCSAASAGAAPAADM